MITKKFTQLYEAQNLFFIEFVL